jgi:hypothetical protein
MLLIPASILSAVFTHKAEESARPWSFKGSFHAVLLALLFLFLSAFSAPTLPALAFLLMFVVLLGMWMFGSPLLYNVQRFSPFMLLLSSGSLCLVYSYFVNEWGILIIVSEMCCSC